MKEQKKHPGYPYQDGNGCWHQDPPQPWSTTIFLIWALFWITVWTATAGTLIWLWLMSL